MMASMLSITGMDLGIFKIGWSAKEMAKRQMQTTPTAWISTIRSRALTLRQPRR